MRCTAEITYLGGQEAGRQVLSETVTRQPVAEIIAVGTGSAPAVSEKPVIADGRITLPTGEVLTYTRTDTVRATAYTHTDRGCDTVTATGTRVHRGTGRGGSPVHSLWHPDVHRVQRRLLCLRHCRGRGLRRGHQGRPDGFVPAHPCPMHRFRPPGLHRLFSWMI